MWYRPIITVISACVLSAGLAGVSHAAVPVATRTPPVGVARVGRLSTVTFRLTLYGRVPAEQTFAVLTAGTIGRLRSGEFPLCTTVTTVQLGLPRCVGDGTRYVHTITVPPGSALLFSFARYRVRGQVPPEIFFDGTQRVSRGATISAYYRFAR